MTASPSPRSLTSLCQQAAGDGPESDGSWSAGLVAPVAVPLGGHVSVNIAPLAAAQAGEDGAGRHLPYSRTTAIAHPTGPVLTATGEPFGVR